MVFLDVRAITGHRRTLRSSRIMSLPLCTTSLQGSRLNREDDQSYQQKGMRHLRQLFSPLLHIIHLVIKVKPLTTSYSRVRGLDKKEVRTSYRFSNDY